MYKFGRDFRISLFSRIACYDLCHIYECVLKKDYMVQHVIYSGTGDHHVCVGLLPGAASAFKTDSHMGFNYLTDKFTGTKRKVYRICRLLLCSAQLWNLDYMGEHRWFTGQYHYHLLTGVLEMPQWTIGIAIPLSAVFSIARMVQYEIRLAKEGN